ALFVPEAVTLIDLGTSLFKVGFLDLLIKLSPNLGGLFVIIRKELINTFLNFENNAMNNISIIRNTNIAESMMKTLVMISIIDF
ncbi:MAG: hypothetical protein RBS19_11910, partial [Bacteroidales bacterium]|nr:hypothetical protein [Bacteroidales bacterium]